MSKEAISFSRKATSSGVMVMFAPGTTMMRLRLEPLGKRSSVMLPMEEGACASTATCSVCTPASCMEPVSAWPNASRPTLPTIVTSAPRRAACTA